MTDRAITSPDLQAVFRFFGAPALAYFHRHRAVPPACVLTWLDEGQPAVRRVHQFPADLLAPLMRDARGRHQLASSITAMLAPGQGADLVPPRPRPHLVVQVLLANVDIGGVTSEVLLLLAHERGLTHASAIPVDAAAGIAELPAMFDVTSTPVGAETMPEE